MSDAPLLQAVRGMQVSEPTAAEQSESGDASAPIVTLLDLGHDMHAALVQVRVRVRVSLTCTRAACMSCPNPHPHLNPDQVRGDHVRPAGALRGRGVAPPARRGLPSRRRVARPAQACAGLVLG